MFFKKLYTHGKFKIVHVSHLVGGKIKSYTIAPGTDISNEPQEVKDACNEAWTPEIIQAYADHKAAQV